MKNLKQPIDDLAEAMLKEIANEQLKRIESTSDGREAQEYCFWLAKKMLKKLMKEYKRVCKEDYQ